MKSGRKYEVAEVSAVLTGTLLVDLLNGAATTFGAAAGAVFTLGTVGADPLYVLNLPAGLKPLLRFFVSFYSKLSIAFSRSAFEMVLFFVTTLSL